MSLAEASEGTAGVCVSIVCGRDGSSTVPSSDQTGLDPVVAGRCGAACTSAIVPDAADDADGADGTLARTG
jgi:hypothetical protein